MCELVGELRCSVQFKNGGLLEEEENWSISDSSEKMKCIQQNDVDGMLDVNVRWPRVDSRVGGQK